MGEDIHFSCKLNILSTSSILHFIFESLVSRQLLNVISQIILGLSKCLLYINSWTLVCHMPFCLNWIYGKIYLLTIAYVWRITDWKKERKAVYCCECYKYINKNTYYMNCIGYPYMKLDCFKTNNKKINFWFIYQRQDCKTVIYFHNPHKF